MAFGAGQASTYPTARVSPKRRSRSRGKPGPLRSAPGSPRAGMTRSPSHIPAGIRSHLRHEANTPRTASTAPPAEFSKGLGSHSRPPAAKAHVTSATAVGCSLALILEHLSYLFLPPQASGPKWSAGGLGLGHRCTGRSPGQRYVGRPRRPYHGAGLSRSHRPRSPRGRGHAPSLFNPVPPVRQRRTAVSRLFLAPNWPAPSTHALPPSPDENFIMPMKVLRSPRQRPPDRSRREYLGTATRLRIAFSPVERPMRVLCPPRQPWAGWSRGHLRGILSWSSFLCFCLRFSFLVVSLLFSCHSFFRGRAGARAPRETPDGRGAAGARAGNAGAGTLSVCGLWLGVNLVGAVGCWCLCGVSAVW